ncbi:endoplasmic reticulum-Golgi intermediate compartment protein 2-like [Acanthaster planci]|uniref:Endoplasmic reticulum-Golgi intermediate compartment protein 2-like n=1 Tax=Acanthaster planci TaxID=133434 RepID=A0A8B7XUW7_ACAPL|nr:endoplasmic reticulum-Golgi intermediate compartment protein 2-like [Acanthaster planci]
MRRLNRKQTLKVVKELDAFPKVPESYQETSSTGGTLALLTFLLIGVLIISEIRYYADTRMKYEYTVDADLNSKLTINVDITVAMKCGWIGADVVDISGETTTPARGNIKEEAVYFEKTPEQRHRQETFKMIKAALSEEHALQDLLFQSGFDSKPTESPPNKKGKGPPDACRLHGSLVVNKVAGNFHVTVGKSIPHPKGHAHLALMVDPSQYNFSHRIDHLSFGEPAPGIINQLDAEEKVTKDNRRIYQYFLQIVPTKVNTRKARMNTHQFAVTERERTINHNEGSHGVSGIFFKYDLSSLEISVTETHEPYSQFLIRLCGIVGGIFATSGILHSFLEVLISAICCRYKFSTHTPSQPTTVPADHQLDHTTPNLAASDPNSQANPSIPSPQ